MNTPTQEDVTATLDALATLPEKLNLWRVLYIVALVVIGFVIIKLLMMVVDRFLRRSKLDRSLHTFIRSSVRAVLIFLVILVVVDALGVPITSLVALFSVVGLALSLAMQGVLSNLAGGIMVLWSKPFQVGDFVRIGGITGTVKDVTLVYTKVNTTDNKLVYLTNKAVSESTVENFSGESVRRVELTFSASYDSPIEDVKGAILAVIAGQPKALDDPAPIVGVIRYGSSAIEYNAWFWCAGEDYWEVLYAVNEGVKRAFDEKGLQMTYDHLNVHMVAGD